MTHDTTDYDKNKYSEEEKKELDSVTPLCLVHYFAERAVYSPERPRKPPGQTDGRVIERRGNLIILEFAPPAKTPPKKWRGGSHGKSTWMLVCDTLTLLLLLASLLGCAAAFRY